MSSARFQIDSGNVLSREVDGELVLLDLRRQVYIGGTRSAAVLWPLLEQGATREELLEALTLRFEVDREQLDSDLDEFLSGLAEHDLLLDPERTS